MASTQSIVKLLVIGSLFRALAVLVKTHVLQNDLLFTKEKHAWCLTSEMDQWRGKHKERDPI